MAIDSTLAATNPQAAYALASVPVTAPQQAQTQQPAFKGSAQPTADTVNFSGAAAYAQPQQEEKSGGIFTLKNLFLTATATVLGLAAVKTHGTMSAFKGLETAIDGTAVKAAKEGEKVAEGAAKKVSDTHEISWLGTFADHLKHPIKLIKSAFGQADDAAIKTATDEAKVKVIGNDAKGLLYQSTAEGNKDVYFRHNDRFIKLTAKSTEEAAAKASKDAGPAAANAAAPAEKAAAKAPKAKPATVQVGNETCTRKDIENKILQFQGYAADSSLAPSLRAQHTKKVAELKLLLKKVA